MSRGHHRLGVLGVQGHYHYVAWLRDRPEVELVGLWEPDDRRAAEAVAFCRCPRVEEAIILADPTIDLVFVAPDPGVKVAVLERALAAGKQVLMDKPWPADLAAVERLAGALAAGQVLVTAYPHCRYNPNLGPVADAARVGHLGPLTVWDQTFVFYSAPGSVGRTITAPKPVDLSTGGEVVNLGCYALDLVTHALGRPARVEARLARLAWPEAYGAVGTEDFAEVRLDYGRTTAHLLLGRNIAPATGFTVSRLHLLGPGLDLLLAPYDKLHRRNGQELPLADNGAESPSVGEHFLAAVAGVEPPRSGLEAGRLVVELTTAIYQSAARGAPVELPLTDPTNPYLAGWRLG